MSKKTFIRSKKEKKRKRTCIWRNGLFKVALSVFEEAASKIALGCVVEVC